MGVFSLWIVLTGFPPSLLNRTLIYYLKRKAIITTEIVGPLLLMCRIEIMLKLRKEILFYNLAIGSSLHRHKIIHDYLIFLCSQWNNIYEIKFPCYKHVSDLS